MKLRRARPRAVAVPHPLLAVFLLAAALLSRTGNGGRTPDGRALRELIEMARRRGEERGEMTAAILGAGPVEETEGTPLEGSRRTQHEDCQDAEPSIAFEAAMASDSWTYYEGLADVLVGMADPIIRKSTMVRRKGDGAQAQEVAEEVILPQTVVDAPHVAQITLLDGGPGIAGKTFDLKVAVGSEAASAFRTSMRNVPVRGVFRDSSSSSSSITTTTMSHDGMQMEMMPMAGEGSEATFIMAPTLEPPCDIDSDNGAVSCSIAGEVQTFENQVLAKTAVVEALAEGITRVFSDHAVPLPRELAMRRARRERRAYVNPAYSLGTERTILFVRSIYNGQTAASVIISHTDAVALATNATRELNRAALGATSFSFTVAPQHVTMAATTPVCTSSYTLVEQSTKAALLSQLSINSALYSHVIILLPKCPTWQFNGLAYIVSTAFLFVFFLLACCLHRWIASVNASCSPAARLGYH
jgi:hypothetical protein